MTAEDDIAWFMDSRPYTHPLPPSHAEAPDHSLFRRLRAQRRRDPADWLDTAIRHDDTFVGFMELYLDRCQPEVGRVGYRILPHYRRRGYGSVALTAMCNYGFDQLGLKTVEARIKPNNANSQGLAQKVGFELAGREAGHLVFAKTP